jgi:ADP-ribose pyrophosphatase YjhB (NUDIX family)
VTEPAWVDQARRLAAAAQNGLFYAANDFDVLRWTEVRRIASALLANGSGKDPARIEALLGLEEGYATPKVDVRALLVDGEGRVCLVRELADGRWSLPGGWADPGDLPSTAAEREVREEAGYRARATRLLACWDRSLMPGADPYPFRIYKLIFDCHVLGEVDRDHSETDDVGWFAPDALPPLSLGRTDPQQVARLLALHADPSAPAAFD